MNVESIYHDITITCLAVRCVACFSTGCGGCGGCGGMITGMVGPFVPKEMVDGPFVPKETSGT